MSTVLYVDIFRLSCPVKLPLASPPSSELQGCGLHVKTLGVAFSTGVQAERGFVVDKEVTLFQLNLLMLYPKTNYI